MEINKDLVEILKNGTKEQKEAVWKQVKAELDANPDKNKFKKNECQQCETIHKLYSWA